MNNREVAGWEQRAKEIKHTPLTGPGIDEAFYVFAIGVTCDGKPLLYYTVLPYK